jgi:photosystem II stability/assembly factor-like uncharacterized protein
MVKRIAVTTAGIGAVVWVACSAAWSTEMIKVADLRPNLFGACFLTAQEGWIIGDRGRIFYTTDGGRTLERLAVDTSRAFLDITCFPDKSLVLVGKVGIIYRSSDGGRTFQALDSGVKKNLLSVAFSSDKQIGIAVGDAGTIIRTEDGGTSWHKVDVPRDIQLPEEIAEVVDPGDVLMYDVSFPTPDRAWIVGEFGAILTSSDAGRTWTTQKSPVPSTLFGVTFTDVNNGWAVGMSSVLLRTRDGGQNWEPIQVPQRLGFPLSLYAISINGQYGWAIGDSGFLLTSSDRGETWKMADVPIQLAATWLRGVSLTADGHGIITGQEGLLLSVTGDKFTPLAKL